MVHFYSTIKVVSVYVTQSIYEPGFVRRNIGGGGQKTKLTIGHLDKYLIISNSFCA